MVVYTSDKKNHRHAPMPLTFLHRMSHKGGSVMRHYFCFILIVLIGSILACGPAATPEKVEPAPVSEETAPPSSEEQPTPVPPTPIPPTPTPAPEIFQVGDAVKLKDTVITVTGVEYSEGDEWEKPDTGKVYLLVHLHMDNAGPDEISVNPFDFKVKDSNGVIVDTGFITFPENELSAVDLAPGGKIDGIVPFEVPRGDPSLQLIYQPNWFIDKERAVIELGGSPQ